MSSPASETTAESGRTFTVVVGVSDSSRSPAALAWAKQEAALHHGVVIAVRAWRPPRPPAAPGGRLPIAAPDTSSLLADAQRELAADISAVLGEDSGVQCRLVHGGRRKVLRSISRFADLLVIDAPQHSDLTASPLFARRLIYTAFCPVVIMPPAVADQSDTPVVAAGKRIGRSLLNAAGTAGRPGVRSPGASP